jgi:3'-phosphoadenosine 5'-phosphosulfate (PAPS) 3'-phosphatase
LALDSLRAILIEAVLAGGTRVLEVQRRGAIEARYKDATELVTDADQQSDAAILAVLQRRCPDVDTEISFHLEESGIAGTLGRKWIGADPLDGTSHFAAGGNLYSVQAHYIEDGVPLVGVVLQPEVFLPLSVSDQPAGRLAVGVRGGGAEMFRTDFVDGAFRLGASRPVSKRPQSPTRTFIGCVPMTGKMTPDERALARRVHDSGILGGMTGTGGAAGNVMMTILGGQQVYCNFGAGDELDLAPGQVIALEAGLTVWGPDRQPPLWHVRKQPVIVAPDDEIAEKFLKAAGL